jgi:acyl-CoA thioester hydrolase
MAATAAHQTLRTNIQVRFADTDALGHINNGSFASYAEVARLEFMLRLGRAVGSLILANLTIDFRRQVKFGETITVDTWVESLGTSSIRLVQLIRANEERAAEVKSVVVHFDYAAGTSLPLTPEMRAALEPFIDRPSGTPSA